MTDINIDAIRQQAHRYDLADGRLKNVAAHQIVARVPALLAKVDELTAALAEAGGCDHTEGRHTSVGDCRAADRRFIQSLHDETVVLNDTIRSLTAELTEAREQAKDSAYAASQARKALIKTREVLAELEPIVKAAEYKYGDLFCINGDCDHAAEVDDDAAEDAPCPLVETRYATGAEIVAITPLLMSTDGDQLDDADEIPVGEIRRVLGEAREAVAR